MGRTRTSKVKTEDPAANLVRLKLSAIYKVEPDASEEVREINQSGAHSKHQKFMAELSASGKSLADIQLEWHKYYQNLDDQEKHQVWQEFYEQHSRAGSIKTDPKTNLEHIPTITRDYEAPAETMADLHQKVITKASSNKKLKAKHHAKSLVFSLVMGALFTGGLFFVTNNERFITPFIQPAKSVAASPLITDGSSVGPDAKIIIPKLNLEAPLVTDSADNQEKTIQASLERGVVLYPDTGLPGEQGNPVFFGHSSNNLFNKGSYKFVFVRLSQLEVGDTYAINYNGKQYVYKVFNKEVVSPDQVGVIYSLPKPVMSTLITCDPPGTSDKRLIIQAEQISPDPSTNTTASQPKEVERPAEIPSSPPSLWRRLLGID